MEEPPFSYEYGFDRIFPNVSQSGRGILGRHGFFVFALSGIKNGCGSFGILRGKCFPAGF